MLGSEQLAPGHSFQGQLPGLNLLPHLGKQNHRLSPASGDLEILPQRTSFVNIGVDAHNGVHSIVGMENPFTTPDRRVVHDEERLERKRKVVVLCIGFLLPPPSPTFQSLFLFYYVIVFQLCPFVSKTCFLQCLYHPFSFQIVLAMMVNLIFFSVYIYG